jgi:O-antigen ligase
MSARTVGLLLVVLGVLVAWSIAGMQLAAGALLAGCWLRGALARESPVRGPALAWAGWAALSGLLSPAPLGTFELTAWKPALLVWVGFAAARAAGPAAVERALRAWVLAMALSCAWGVAQVWTGTDLLVLLHLRRSEIVIPSPSWGGHFSPLGFFNSRLTLAHAALVPLGVAGAWVLAGTRRERVQGALAAAVLGAALVLGFTRAAWWGALVLGLGLLVATRSYKLLAALGLGGALLLGVGPVRARMASSLSVGQNTDRVFIWARAREVIADHPVWGVGFGAYPEVAAPYYDRADPTFPMRTWAHDTFLSMLAEVGPLGVALYLWLWLSVGLAAWPALKCRDPQALGLAAGVLGVHVAGLFHDVLYDGEVAFALFLAGGLLAARGDALSKPTDAP